MAATHTPYYNLNKPDRQDFVSVVTDINDNMDKIDTALHGKASLDNSGKVPASELPSYVDDVIEGYLYNGQFYKESSHTTLITPEGDKIYVDIPTSSSYRWSGSLYVKIDDPKEIIDDTAGLGDTDLVYSADKVRKELDTKAPVVDVPLTTPASVQSFPDGADGLPMALKVAVEPVQDLHGYENPWPGGVGKNKYNNQVGNVTTNGVTFTKNNDGTITVNNTATSNAYYNMTNVVLPSGDYIFNGCPANGSDSTFELDLYNNTTSTPMGSDRGNGQSFTANGTDEYRLYIRIANGYNAQNLVFKPMIRLSSVSDATYAPYSNICPISGWTGAKVTRTGFNLINKSTITHGYFVDGNNNSAPSSDWAYSDYIQVKGGETYYYTIPQYVGVNKIFEYDSNKNVIGKLNGGVSAQTLDEKCCYVRLNMKETDVDNARFNVSDPAKNGTYEPYQPIQTVTIDLNGTRYGGTLTVNKDGTGELVVDRVCVNLSDARTQGWQLDGDGTSSRRFGNQYYTSIPVAKNESLSYISSHLKPTGNTNNSAAFGNFYINPSWLVVHDNDNHFASLDAFKSWISTENVMICYKIATPVTYSLTHGQVKTLLGVNNIFADCGPVLEITAPRDTKLYIDERIAELQALILENIGG